ncbi:hypothetical protein [Halobacteriovorax sp. DA5]|uniref:hypothetical protein n=1 Tax=Halobacteriovorax sp. DA5 TaxID=2067553 RepID=UPI0011AF8C37|nr:hypothetical protein [Halobacteriovorax sp. DA5]
MTNSNNSSFLKNIFSKFSKKKFKFLSISTCMIADAFVAFYLYLVYANPQTYRESFKIAYQSLRLVDPNIANGIKDPHFQDQVIQLMVHTVISIICVYLIIHLIIYIFRLYNKKFAQSYIKLYSWTGGVLMISIALFNLDTPRVAMFMIPGFLLLFNALGFKHVDQMKEE